MPTDETVARVLAVAARSDHRFSKTPQSAIRLLAGLGVEGDAHSGATVKHRSRENRHPARRLQKIHFAITPKRRGGPAVPSRPVFVRSPKAAGPDKPVA